MAARQMEFEYEHESRGLYVLLSEAIEGLEHIPAEEGSWLDRTRKELEKWQK